MVSYERREHNGYASFTLPPLPKERLTALLREGDRIYDDGTAVSIIAPVYDEQAAESLAARVERQLQAPVNKLRYVPKENALIAGDLEINTVTKEAYLHSPRPLSREEIAATLNATLREHPEAVPHIEAVYARSDESASYFRAHNHEGTIILLSCTAHRDPTHIPVRAAVRSGFVVCPLKPGNEPSYHSLTKTLTINNGKQ